MTSGPFLLGIDLGTSSVKALLASAAGEIAGTGSAEYPILAPRPGFAEQEPQHWWAATQSAVRAATAGVPDAEIAAIGLSGQMHGTVLLDKDGELLGPAVIWPDQRSRAQVEAIAERVGPGKLVEFAGSPVATGFMAATLLWMREERPDIFSRIGCALLPKDWLRLQMTGELATDPSDASGAVLLDTRERLWSEIMLGVVGLEEDQLPVVLPSASAAGTLSGEAAAALGLRAGTPVIVGAADAACALLGAGAIDPSLLVVNLSTGGQIVRPVATPVVDQAGRMHTFCSALEPEAGAAWYQMGATLSVGMALRWLRTQVLGWEADDAYEQMTALAAQAGIGAGGLLFLPYLVGERTPHMDPQARAAFLGLTLSHGQPHLVRAVLEGATFACYDAYRVLLASGPAGRRDERPPESIILAGGGARSLLWQQIVADVFGVPVQRLLVTEQSATGAALLAGSGAGLLDLVTAAQAWAKLSPRTEPDALAHARYSALFELYQDAYRANRTLFHALSAR